MFAAKRRLVGALKLLPGLRRLLAERDGWQQVAADLEVEAGNLRREREVLRSALAQARLDPSDWRPAYIENKPAAKSEQNWQNFLRASQTFGGLRADSAVLDIGCGVGGMARQILGVLGPGGRYDGIDVDPRAIAVCNAVFEQANFTFTPIDVRNDEYNPTGTIAANEFTFPFDDASFDLVLARSLFTHMHAAGAARYVAEIGRTLRPGGRALITAFLINEAVADRLAAGAQPSQWTFPHDHGDQCLQSSEQPLMAVALKESFARSVLQREGLDLVEPIQYGSWSGGNRFLLHQDLMVVEQPRSQHVANAP